MIHNDWQKPCDHLTNICRFTCYKKKKKPLIIVNYFDQGNYNSKNKEKSFCRREI
jgi:hypothetical protein